MDASLTEKQQLQIQTPRSQAIEGVEDVAGEASNATKVHIEQVLLNLQHPEIAIHMGTEPITRRADEIPPLAPDGFSQCPQLFVGGLVSLSMTKIQQREKDLSGMIRWRSQGEVK